MASGKLMVKYKQVSCMSRSHQAGIGRQSQQCPRSVCGGTEAGTWEIPRIGPRVMVGVSWKILDI